MGQKGLQNFEASLVKASPLRRPRGMEALSYDLSTVRVIRVRGRMDEAGVATFVRQAYREVLRTPGNLVLNLEALDEVCDSGLAMLYQLVRKLGRSGARLGVVPPKRQGLGWEMLASGTWVELFGSEFSAVQGLTSEARRTKLIRDDRPR